MLSSMSASGLIARSLAPYKLALCASPSYFEGRSALQHPSELAQHECLVYAHSELRTDWTFNGPDGMVTVPIKGRFVADHEEPLLCAARAGLGIILQPLELLEGDIARGTLIDLLPDFHVIERPLHVLHAADRRPTAKLRPFIDSAVQAFG